MITAQKIVIHSKSGYDLKFDELVYKMIQAKVESVAIQGKDSQLMEDIIDELCVGDGSEPYFMMTTSHPDESLEETIRFAKILANDDEVQVIEY